jgi:hypothetical protein
MTKMGIVIILPDDEDVARKTYKLLTGNEPKEWGKFKYKSARLIVDENDKLI